MMLLKRILIDRCIHRCLVRCASTIESDMPIFVDKLHGNHSGIHVWKINRPRVYNAISFPMIKQLRELCEESQFDPDMRVVIISSKTPRMFCAGADLKERRGQIEAEYRRWSWSARQLSVALADLPVPVIAAIDGPALGGGMEIALSCDMRIAASNAKMGFPETSLAIIPGMGGTQRLPRLVGSAVAKELLYTARVVGAEEAAHLRLVNAVVPQDEDTGLAAYAAAVDAAERVLDCGPIAIRMAKMAINKGLEVDLQSGLAIEQNCYAQVIPTKDRIEALNAFKEKRKAMFRGE